MPSSPSPNPAQPVVLVYGADAGLVRERAETSARVSVDDMNDPFSLVRLEGDLVAGEPSRLVEEANTIPLFGGRRAVWVKAGGRNLAPAVEIPARRRAEGMPRGDRGRRAAQKRAAACRVREGEERRRPACYADSDKDMPRLIDYGDAGRRPHHCAGRARRAGAAARRRPAGVTQRVAQARDLCARRAAVNWRMCRRW